MLCTYSMLHILLLVTYITTSGDIVLTANKGPWQRIQKSDFYRWGLGHINKELFAIQAVCTPERFGLYTPLENVVSFFHPLEHLLRHLQNFCFIYLILSLFI